MPAAQRPWPVVREYSRGHNRAAAIVDYDRLAQAFMQLLTEYTADDVGAAMDETRIVPIVFVRVADPLGDGVVDSMAKPSGNVTGFSVLEPSIAGKWLQLLREIAPGVAPVTVMFNPATASLSGRIGFFTCCRDCCAIAGDGSEGRPRS